MIAEKQAMIYVTKFEVRRPTGGNPKYYMEYYTKATPTAPADPAFCPLQPLPPTTAGNTHRPL